MSRERYMREGKLMREIEAFYIAKFDSANPEKGYNTHRNAKYDGNVVEIVGRKIVRKIK